MMLTYILNEEGEPVPTRIGSPQWDEWEKHSWELGPRSRRVALDFVGNYKVSTVFLSMDHGFGGGEPVLWETMVFSAATASDDEDSEEKEYRDEWMARYTSRKSAEEGHAMVVSTIREKGEPPGPQ